MRRWEPAVIRAGLERTRFALNPLCRRVKWQEPLRQLRPEQRQRRYTAKRRQVPRSGVVADERARAIHQRNQFGHGRRCRHVGLARLQPPVALVRVARDPDGKRLLPQPRGQPAIRSSGQTRTGWPAPL